MDKILVVVYSYTGTSHRVGQMLCGAPGWARGDVFDEKPRLGGLAGNLRCVFDSLLHRRPRIRYAGPDPRQFAAVVLVSPIWARRLAGPMRSFVAGQRDALKHLAVVSVTGAGGAEAAVAEIGRLLGRPLLATTSVSSREVGDCSLAARLEAFGKVVETAETPPSSRPGVWSPRTARPCDEHGAPMPRIDPAQHAADHPV